MTISRRALLRAGAGGLAAGGLVTWSGSAAGSGVGKVDWSRLSACLQGTLVLPADSAYTESKQVYFSEYDTVHPAAIAYCETAADVEACLSYAHYNGIRAVARSGGHSPGGYSLSTGLVVDLSRLNSVTSDANAVTIGPGVQQVDALRALWPLGLGIVGGLCPTVGAAGYVQGGGIGMLTRRYGLGCDRLTGADVVLADGRLVHASATSEPDLFWALRGGGGGNFGIVTSMTVTPVPVSTMTNFSTSWSYDDAPAVLAGWQSWAAASAWQLGSGMVVQLTDAAPGNTPVVLVFGAWTGTTDALNAALDDLTDRIGAAPTSRTVMEFSYYDAMMQRYNCSDKTVDQCHIVGTGPVAELPRAGFTVERSRLFGAPLPATGIDDVFTAFEADRRPGVTHAIHGAGLLGGQANQMDPTATAFVHRGVATSVSFSAALPAANPAAADSAAAVAWATQGFAVLSRYSTETYQNFIDPYLADWRQSYYGANYARLAQVKNEYDPHRFFDFAQAI